eukprot:TRINITY_DN4542_c0_g1_i2.p1 TRINITY_DN4542_c0_g1~~TRINITY_DN4542_c0_g1_i2.p1  ORF type:complete len:782 (+),score=127.82 TRINITY_DN4542_c0_g1_i2:425-2770(+)
MQARRGVVALHKCLHNENVLTRRKACLGIAHISREENLSDEQVDDVIQFVSDPDIEIRSNIFRILSNIGNTYHSGRLDKKGFSMGGHFFRAFLFEDRRVGLHALNGLVNVLELYENLEDAIPSDVTISQISAKILQSLERLAGAQLTLTEQDKEEGSELCVVTSVLVQLKKFIESFVNGGGIEVLMSIITKTSSAELNEFCLDAAISLSKICFDDDFNGKVMEKNGYPFLLNLMKQNVHDDVKGMASTCLAHISKNSTLGKSLDNEGFIETFIELTKSPVDEVVQNAHRGLGNITLTMALVPKVYNKGGIDIFGKALFSPDLKIQQFGAYGISNFMKDDVYLPEITSKGYLEKIMSLFECENLHTCWNAFFAVESLIDHGGRTAYLISKDIFRHLIKLFFEYEADMIEDLIVALHALAKTPEGYQHLRDAIPLQGQCDKYSHLMGYFFRNPAFRWSKFLRILGDTGKDKTRKFCKKLLTHLFSSSELLEEVSKDKTQLFELHYLAFQNRNSRAEGIYYALIPKFIFPVLANFFTSYPPVLELDRDESRWSAIVPQDKDLFTLTAAFSCWKSAFSLDPCGKATFPCQLFTGHSTHYDPNWFSDVTLVIGNLRLPCHRVLLGGNSEYFKKMFSRFCEKEKQEVEIKEVDPKLFEIIISSVYSSHVTIESEEEYFEILRVADMFQMTHLMQALMKKLITVINEKNFGECFQWVDHFDFCGFADLKTKFFKRVVASLQQWGFLKDNTEMMPMLLSYLPKFGKACLSFTPESCDIHLGKGYFRGSD